MRSKIVHSVCGEQPSVTGMSLVDLVDYFCIYMYFLLLPFLTESHPLPPFPLPLV